MKSDFKKKPKAKKTSKSGAAIGNKKPKSLSDLKKKLDKSKKFEKVPKQKVKGKDEKPSFKAKPKGNTTKDKKPSSNEPPNYSHKPYAKLVDQMKVPWNRVREHSTPAEDRKKAVHEMIKSMQGHIMDVTLRHDASRLVQAILQFGNQTQQDQILTELGPKFTDVCKSPYGHFVILKAITYCNETSQMKKICQSVSGQFVSLATHAIGARVVETILQLYPHALTTSLKAEFYGKKFLLLLPEPPKSLRDLLTSSPQKTASILDHMRDLSHKLIQKQLTTFVYVHKLLWEYIQEIIPQNLTTSQLLHAEQEAVEGRESNQNNPLHRMTDLVSTLIDSAPKLLATNPGAKVMVLVITFTPAKDRKRILKSLKGHVLESLTHAADAAWMGIVRLIDVVDDTVLVQKSLLDELNKSSSGVIKYAADGTQLGEVSAPWLQIMRHRSGHKLLIRLCTPTRRHIDSGDGAEALFTMTSPFSKKNDMLRRKEHFIYIKSSVQRIMLQNLEVLVRCRVGSRVIASWYEAAMPSELAEGLAAVFCGQQQKTTVMDEEEEGDEMDVEEEREEDEDDAATEEEANEDDIDTVPEEDADVDEEMDEEVEDDEGNEAAAADDEEYQTFLEEAAADQKQKANKGGSKVQETTVATSDLPIAEDPTAHVLMKRLLRFENAFIHHLAQLRQAELSTAQTEVLEALKHFAQTQKAGKAYLMEEDEVLARVIQDDTLRSDDTALFFEDNVLSLKPCSVGQRILENLLQNQNALLVEWLQCNRPCFVLTDLFQQPALFEQMLDILNGVDAAVLQTSFTKTEGGKTLAKLYQTRLELQQQREATSSKSKPGKQESKKRKNKQ